MKSILVDDTTAPFELIPANSSVGITCTPGVDPSAVVWQTFSVAGASQVTVPPWAKSIDVWIRPGAAGGSGGGSGGGGFVSGTNAGGGGGGAGARGAGSCSAQFVTCIPVTPGAVLDVVVGAGGAGGAGGTAPAAGAPGNPGSWGGNGNPSSIQVHLASDFLVQASRRIQQVINLTQTAPNPGSPGLGGGAGTATTGGVGALITPFTNGFSWGLIANVQVQIAPQAGSNGGTGSAGTNGVNAPADVVDDNTWVMFGPSPQEVSPRIPALGGAGNGTTKGGGGAGGWAQSGSQGDNIVFIGLGPLLPSSGQSGDARTGGGHGGDNETNANGTAGMAGNDGTHGRGGGGGQGGGGGGSNQPGFAGGAGGKGSDGYVAIRFHP